MIKKRACIKCDYLLINGQMDDVNIELFETDFPNYFKTIKSQQLIIAHDAVHNVSTEEFAKNYLIPNHIKSMMDAPFFDRGELGGVICCEHQHEMKYWDLQKLY